MERAYKARLDDDVMMSLLIQHIRGMLDVASQNGKDLLIKQEGEYAVVYYVNH